MQEEARGGVVFAAFHPLVDQFVFIVIDVEGAEYAGLRLLDGLAGERGVGAKQRRSEQSAGDGGYGGHNEEGAEGGFFREAKARARRRVSGTRTPRFPGVDRFFPEGKRLFGRKQETGPAERVGDEEIARTSIRQVIGEDQLQTSYCDQNDDQ